MVERERLILEEHQHEDGEDGQGEELLDHLQLPEVERTAILDETDAVGRHHETVLDQGDAPAEQDNHRQRELAEPSGALQLQVTVPRERHEDIRTNQEQECVYTFHIYIIILLRIGWESTPETDGKNNFFIVLRIEKKVSSL